MRTIIAFSLLVSLQSCLCFAQSEQVRVIVIGAHPDDCEIKAGGTAALFASMGYAVEFISVTNGDAGHQSKGGGSLARIRAAESKEAGRRLGIAEYIILDNHDGELVPSLEVRMQIIKEIRRWNADVVIGHRPNDYHPDHRYTAMLIQDAAFLVTVPNIAAGVPALKKNPLFLYMRDRFQKPLPFTPDITIDISETFSKKIDALDAHQSQMYEWGPWIGGFEDEVPKSAKERKEWLTERRSQSITPEMRNSLEKWYGKERAAKVTHAEAFEICEYGKQPTDEDIRLLFPMLQGFNFQLTKN